MRRTTPRSSSEDRYVAPRSNPPPADRRCATHLARPQDTLVRTGRDADTGSFALGGHGFRAGRHERQLLSRRVHYNFESAILAGEHEPGEGNANGMDDAIEKSPGEAPSLRPAFALTFNDLLRKAGYRLERIRLLRHREPGALRGRSPYELWRDDRAAFDVYQAQHAEQPHRSLVEASHWASFVGTPQDETMFVGFYRSKYIGLSQAEVVSPTTNKKWASSVHLYKLELDEFLSEYIGRLFISWDGARPYIRRVDRKEWPITEIRAG